MPCCSVIGHVSPLAEDTVELKEGDVVKMCAYLSLQQLQNFPVILVTGYC